MTTTTTTTTTTTVRCFPADTAACGSYRIIWPADALAGTGAPLAVRVDLPQRHEDLRMLTHWDRGRKRRVVDEVDLPGADVVVVQRPLASWWPGVLAHWRRAGVFVIVDLDDDLENVDRRHAAYHAMHPRWSPESNWSHTRAAVRNADRLIVTTDTLAARYTARDSRTRVVVVPNTVPARYLTTRPAATNTGDLPVVGWTGQMVGHPGDLEATRGGIGMAQRSEAFTFRVVGDAAGVRDALALPDQPDWVPFVPIDAYPAEVARFDVGVVPLQLSQFNASKSWLKGLELAALGVPFVAAPTTEYRRLASLGAGNLARQPADWRAHLLRLVRSAAAREDQAARGRQVAEAYTIEGMVDAWTAAWTP